MAFTDLFVRRPVLAFVVSALILLVGLQAALTLPIRQYPQLEAATITVTTQYPGASPDLMQGFVTAPISESIASASGVEYLASTSTQGQSVIKARLALNANSDRAMVELMAKVNEVKYRLPPEVYDPVIVKSTGEATAVLYLGFASDTVPLYAVSDYVARVVQPLVATVPGVASTQIEGGQSLAMRVWVDPARLAAHGVSAAELADALQRNNFQAAPGQVKGVWTVANVRTDTDLAGVEDFRSLVVKATPNALVRLKDVATVELGAKSTDQTGMMDGKRAVYLAVNATPRGNPLTIVSGVKALLPEIDRSLPPTVEAAIPFEVATFVEASIDEVRTTLVEAVVIVVVVIFLFLGSGRAVLVPLVTIPLSLVGAAALMLAMDFSLNLLTLLAMVLAIGLVVDDAIVVLENVYRHMEEGRTPVQAALIGAREIVGPIIAMTITLAAVYAPIGLMGGLTGTLFKEFAFTLAGAVVISGVVALTLSPAMCSLLLSRQSMETRLGRFVEHGFQRLATAYGRLLHASLDHRPVTAVFALIVFAAVPVLFLSAQRELAPEEDQGSPLAMTKGPQYANIDYTEAFAQRLEAVFRAVPERRSTWMINGIDGPSNGIGGIELVPWKDRERSEKQIVAALQAAVGEIEGQSIFAFSLPALPGSTGGLPIQMVISSPRDHMAAFDIMDRIKDAARRSGLFVVVDSDLDFNNPVVRIRIDRAKANELGITMQAIGATLATLVGENYVNRFGLQGRSYDVIPQVPRGERLSPESLIRYYVPARDGSMVPLSTVVRLDAEVGPNKLTQFNQMNAATLQAIAAPGVSMGDAVAFLDAQARALLPDGFRHDWLADSRQYVQEGDKLTVTFLFALIVIYLVLAAQFESLRDPLVILVTVPLSICGALTPLYLGFATLNIYTQIGLVTLVGLISKHGILMVEFANKLQETAGLDRRAAIEQSARIRLRPILMTTAAMVAGLVPLLYATGAGAESRFSIGIVVVLGLMVGTLFTLFVLPAVYTVLARDHAHAGAGGRAAELAALDAAE
ncbi:MexW/MexI family multidrug efflux RND transporter permease subunit [Vineibacter terrae]|uniref:MexW/MexI family multidrug efflux RND transporter permease subunit n=1 Tax=Vineibacter terrae TaxID=2586908 RepID=UPI002E30100E|nr:MexW/MexI family multidrug efflux RND transporter permease subunit [Vineibacter terrae]HEX2890028.1 MexW/MexI family multidrug efflux RND transporter permease subunit [Vineibacter terrae]